MSTEAGIDVQRQLESLIQDFRSSDPPMPVIVLHAEDPADDDRVTELVDELREGQLRHGTRLAVAPTGPQPENLDPTAQAVRLLRDLGDSRKWGDRSAAYRPYSFPRLGLVRTLQEATEDEEMRQHWPTAPTGTPDGNAQREQAQTHLLRILARQRWRPLRPSRRPRQVLLNDVQQFLPMGVLGAFTALLTRPEWYVAVRRLHAAGLPVVSGTNSATYLPKDFANWFSLAAPDEHQADALGLVARQLRTRNGTSHALVLTRDVKESQDRYTSEQALYGGEMLRREGFRMLPPRSYRVANGKPELRLHAESICRGKDVPSVIYFAGRVEDVGPLMTQLGVEPGCANREMSILTGDDLSKARFSGTGGRDGVAPRITLYHAALAELREAASGTAFYQDAVDHLPWLEDGEATYDAPDFASGQTALAHDATRALYWAASLGDVRQSRAATWVNLRGVKLDGMATGTIDLTDAPLYGERRGHSIVLKRVRRTLEGVSKAEVLCGRPAGDTEPLGVKECSIK